MRCPVCSSDRTSVIDSRSAPDLIRRRRNCLNCDHRFTTYERIEESVTMIVKKDGRREPFDRNKVRHGLIKACEKRPVSVDVIEREVENVEQRVRASEEREISSLVIGEWLMEALRRIDPVAYIRFASVYREFSDVSQFADTLQALMEEHQSLSQRKPRRVGNSK